MAKRVIIWTQTAVSQRRSILLYWTRRNKSTQYAEKLIKVISRHVKIIERHPEAFKETEYPGTRESALGHFSLFYKTTKDKIIITAFWDNRQDPKKLLRLLQK